MFQTQKVFLLILVLLALSASLAMADSPCAHLTLGLNPTSVARGGNVKATASVQNCSNEFEKFAIHFSGKGPCDWVVSLGNVYMGFTIGSTRTATLSFTVPQEACTGTATVTARVYYKGALITSSKTTLLVQ